MILDYKDGKTQFGWLSFKSATKYITGTRQMEELLTFIEGWENNANVHKHTNLKFVPSKKKKSIYTFKEMSLYLM